MNLNTFSLMATAPSKVRGLKVSAFPETFLFRLHFFFFYWNAGKYLQEQYFIAASPQQTKNVNEKKARKKVYLKQQGMVRGTRLEMVSVKSVVLNLFVHRAALWSKCKSHGPHASHLHITSSIQTNQIYNIIYSLNIMTSKRLHLLK